MHFGSDSTSHLAAFVAIVSVGTSVQAQPFLDFHDVPIISTQSPETFQTLFSRGHCGTVRAIMLGDSQETCPGGLGSVYVPRLDYELFLRYGNSPETPLMGPLAHNGGGNPWSEWLLRNSNAGPGCTESRVPSSFLPPSLVAGKSSLPNGNNVNNNQWYGGLYCLQSTASNIDPGSQINGSQEFFKKGDAVYMDILAATNASSGEVRVRVTPSTTPAPDYYQPNVSTFTTTMGLEQPSLEIKHTRVGPLPFNARPYMQVELSGSDPAKFTDILGARYVSSVDSRGWAITSFSLGGYRTLDFLNLNADCGPILAAVEPDVAFLAYGTNDLGQDNGQTLDQIHAQLLTLISLLRTNISPDFPIILLAEADRSLADLPPEWAPRYDQFAGMLMDIALSTPNVCAVNGRLLTDQQGWSRAADLSQFLADNVHYNPYGAHLKAQLEIEALYSAFATRCYADLDDGSRTGRPDCAVNLNDLLYFLDAFETGSAGADLDNDGDPAISSPDGAVDVNDLLFFLIRFEAGC